MWTKSKCAQKNSFPSSQTPSPSSSSATNYRATFDADPAQRHAHTPKQISYHLWDLWTEMNQMMASFMEPNLKCLATTWYWIVTWQTSIVFVGLSAAELIGHRRNATIRTKLISKAVKCINVLMEIYKTNRWAWDGPETSARNILSAAYLFKPRDHLISNLAPLKSSQDTHAAFFWPNTCLWRSQAVAWIPSMWFGHSGTTFRKHHGPWPTTCHKHIICAGTGTTVLTVFAV